MLAAGCASNPVTGQREVSLISEAEEIEIGRRGDAEIRREMGVYRDEDLQRYVTGIGERIASVSHRPRLPWTFAVLDAPAVNAFALPGGFVYVTRGLLAHIGDEAELAGVLGHEVGHVAARHVSQQYTRSAGTSLAVLLVSIFVPAVQPFGDLANAGLGTAVPQVRSRRRARIRPARDRVRVEGRVGSRPACRASSKRCRGSTP